MSEKEKYYYSITEVAEIGVIVLMFCAFNFISLALVTVLTFAVVLLSRVPLKMYLKSLKVILIVVLLTSVLNLFLVFAAAPEHDSKSALNGEEAHRACAFWSSAGRRARCRDSLCNR